MARKQLLLFILLLGLLSAARGQDENYNNQVWVDLNPRWVPGGGKVVIDGSLGYRTIFPRDWDRYTIGLGARYSPFIHRGESSIALQYLQFRAGIRDFYTASLEGSNLNEIRLYQGVRVQWPTFQRVLLLHYVRVEERFEKVEGTDTRDFTARFRYRLTSKFRFIKPALINLYIPLSVELFLSSSEGIYFNDVTRITPGVGYDFTDQFSTEFHLSYHFSRNSGTDSFENNDLVFRLRAYFTF